MYHCRHCACAAVGAAGRRYWHVREGSEIYPPIYAHSVVGIVWSNMVPLTVDPTRPARSGTREYSVGT